MNPEYPVYIVSKGRWESRLTSKTFDALGVPYQIVVEEHEYDNYLNEVGESKLLKLPQRYLDEYDTFDQDDDPSRSKGPGSARNFCWEHSIENGYPWHWVLDDNINGFERLNRNQRYRVTSGTIFKCAEDFVNRYTNIAQAGFEYRQFGGGARRKKPPFRLNNRIYSCLLINNAVPHRWRGRYNEDTDLSIRVMEDGWCTVMFNAFLQNKIVTQQLKGGNTEEFYAKEGTLLKSQMIVDMHPDIAKLVERYGRWHHEVNYSKFKTNELIRKEGVIVESGFNNYGMELVPIHKCDFLS
jgi:hypothetical protein